MIDITAWTGTWYGQEYCKDKGHPGIPWIQGGGLGVAAWSRHYMHSGGIMCIGEFCV